MKKVCVILRHLDGTVDPDYYAVEVPGQMPLSFVAGTIETAANEIPLLDDGDPVERAEAVILRAGEILGHPFELLSNPDTVEVTI